MKIAIIGSRGFNDYHRLNDVLNPVKSKISLIVSGGARGADSLAEKFAKENNIPTQIFLPDWDKHEKKAGFLRNVDIILAADVVIAFWDGQSKGTYNGIELAKKHNKPFKIIAV
jgi:hypothetical protein